MRLRLVLAAMPLVEIGQRVRQPPVELAARFEGLFEVVRGPLGIVGKIIEEAELVKFERRKAVELVKRAQRLVGAGDIAHRHARPCPSQRPHEPMYPVLG